MPVKFSIVFTEAARHELIEAQDWYESKQSGLGRRFRQSIGLLVDRMIANPLQFPVSHRNIRRALLRRFPYGLFFVIKDQYLVVVACFHGSRDPKHWQKRD